MDTLSFSQLTIIHWFFLILFVILAIILLIKAVREFRSSEPSYESKEKLRRSFRASLYGGGFWVSCLLALGVIFWANLGIRAALFTLVLIGGCTLPLFFLIGVVGTYIQLSWVQGLRRTIDFIGEQEIKKRERKL